MVQAKLWAQRGAKYCVVLSCQSLINRPVPFKAGIAVYCVVNAFQVCLEDMMSVLKHMSDSLQDVPVCVVASEDRMQLNRTETHEDGDSEKRPSVSLKTALKSH